MKTLCLALLVMVGLGGLAQRAALADDARPASPPPSAGPFTTGDVIAPPGAAAAAAPAEPPPPELAPGAASPPRARKKRLSTLGLEKLGTAPPGATPPLRATEMIRRTRDGAWYGPYSLGADVAFALSAYALVEKESSLAVIPIVSLVFAGPLVHASHDRPGSALSSFLLRAVLPVTLGVLAAGSSDGCDSCDGPDFSRVGGAAAAGLAIGVALDWTLLPHREVIVEEVPRRRAKPRRRATVIPLVSAGAHGAMFGAAATF